MTLCGLGLLLKYHRRCGSKCGGSPVAVAFHCRVAPRPCALRCWVGAGCGRRGLPPDCACTCGVAAAGRAAWDPRTAANTCRPRHFCCEGVSRVQIRSAAPCPSRSAAPLDRRGMLLVRGRSAPGSGSDRYITAGVDSSSEMGVVRDHQPNAGWPRAGTSVLIHSPRSWSLIGVWLTGDTVRAGLRWPAPTWCVQVEAYCGWVRVMESAGLP